MHRPEYIAVIKDAAAAIGAVMENFSADWAIAVSKDAKTEYIIGNTFPLNSSATYKICRNKNICADVLSANGIPCLPHQLLFTPAVLNRRNKKVGNLKTLHEFIEKNGYPFVIKKNNSSTGEGVYLIGHEVDLEGTLSKVYGTETTVCLCPYREIAHEYRNIVLDGKCLLSYEKQRAFITGDGSSTILELLAWFCKDNGSQTNKKLFDIGLLKRSQEIVPAGTKVYLQWQHNTSIGSTCKIVDNDELKRLSIQAAQAVNARFVSVDIIDSRNVGLEILEINASVVLNLFTSMSAEAYQLGVNIFKQALQKVFTS